ncbi:Tungsten-containing aldehyde ferredoxin oxidoreductase [Candidatus Lokiarchaeum ossiferum]|uniref:Tungsten-containing aldehyde ferredoxin oxidoreductase n=1 Tax=Candidatus Lokiarchaeum ossiferum TaxID=2951803 RepID=A0ABY6HQZ3_9ARCH|nr:Tungsten-containing aldehyde ferredoxin oxidoreductase [Candidatus Lokiarchaeum sp. B-35]
MANGMMNKFLHVNLSSKTVEEKPEYNEYMKEYLGGSGVGTKIIYELTKGKDIKTMDAFSPDNLLVIASGAGTGVVGFPSPSRYHVMCTKSPLTGSIGSANSGGAWGYHLKKGGYDGVVFEGKAEGPVYLAVLDGKVEIVDGTDLVGKDVFGKTDALMEKYKDLGYKVSVACVSNAAENGSEMASIMNDYHRAAGRTGVGAVMASKNLLAVVAGGMQTIELADKDAFKVASKEALGKLKENGLTGQGLPAYGTALLVNVINGVGSLPQKNWQFGSSEESDKISGETLAKDHLRKKNPCWGCSIACGRATKVDDGPFAIAETEGPEYESIWAFGNDCGIYDLKPIIMANHLCDQYGLDTISMGSTVACAMELAEKGFIPAGDYAGIDLKFGSGQGLVDAIKAAGQGKTEFGKLLAKGSRRLAKHYGHPELSMEVKGLDMPAYDPRGIKGIGLNYATSNRGGCHVTGYTIAPEIAGLPEQIDRLDYESKPFWVMAFQNLTAMINSSGSCLFTSFALGGPDYANLLNPIMGKSYTGDDMFAIGDKIYCMQRVLMDRMGVEKDTLPDRLLKTPMPEGVSKGEICELDKMLPEYYKLRGWTPDGKVSEEKMKELGI